MGSNGQLLATAAVSTTNTDPVPADNVSSVAVTMVQSSDLATTITGPVTANAGQSVQYTATFLNNGFTDAVGVAATAQLPAGLGSVTVTDGAGTTVSASYNATTGRLTLPATATQAAGTAQTFRITFTATAVGMVVSSSVSSTSPDDVAANNSASGGHHRGRRGRPGHDGERPGYGRRGQPGYLHRANQQRSAPPPPPMPSPACSWPPASRRLPFG